MSSGGGSAVSHAAEVSTEAACSLTTQWFAFFGFLCALAFGAALIITAASAIYDAYDWKQRVDAELADLKEKSGEQQ